MKQFSISLCMPDEMIGRITAEAMKTDRSFSAQARHFIERGMSTTISPMTILDANLDFLKEKA